MLAAVLLALTVLPAQSPTGEIAGVVRDPSGAVVPQAEIQVTNQNTGERKSATTNSSGEYVLTQLGTGTYTASVKPPAGFRSLEQKNLALTALQSLRVDFRLEIGEATQTVNVTAETALVDTRSALYGTLVDDRRIKDLPLNGRNALDLMRLIPGVNSVGTSIRPSFGQQAMRINGGRQTGVNFLLDGGAINYFHRGVGLQVPPPDALQEFRAVTVGTPAEYGRGSVVISAVTRSGSNDFHGSLWEFLRNDAMDARNFFAATTPKLRFNQFGVAGGGPILIPKLYNGRNKTFWFFTYQGLRIREDQLSPVSTPPTADQLRGDFSAVRGGVLDPVTNLPFPNGIIPTSRFDPVAARLNTEYVPKANAADGTYRTQVSRPTSGNQYVGRLDQVIGSRNRLSFRFFTDASAGVDSFTGSSFAGYNSFVSSQDYKTATIEDTHTFSTRLLNSLRATFTRFDYRENNSSRITLKELGATNFVHAGGSITLPQITIVGRYNLGVGRDRQRLSDGVSLADDVSLSLNRHQLKFGFDIQRNRFLYRDNANSGGNFRFDGSQTRDALADFLLGRARTLQQASPLDTDQRYTPLSFYAQDTWRVGSRVTLSLGLRIETYPAWKDQYGKLTSFVAGARSERFPTAPVGLVFPGDSAYPYRDDHNNLGPRFGLAWDVFGTGRTSVRASYGIFYEPLTAEMAGGVLAPQPFGLVTNLNVVQLSSPYAGQVNPFPYTVDSKNANFVTPISIPKSYSSNLRTPYTQNYSIGVQHQLGNSYLVEAAYVGNVGRKLPFLRELNIARITPDATARNLSARRIYAPNFETIGQLYSDGNSVYNALQVQLQKRLSRGLTFSTNFTWAKAIDEISLTNAVAQLSQQSYQNPLDRRGERALADNDIRRRWASSFLYELPLLRGTEWYARVLGGWELGGIVVLASGNPFGVVSGQDISASGIGNDRPDLVGDPRLDSGRNRAQKIDRYFNTAAFRANQPLQFGTSGRNIVTGPGSFGFDTSLSKSFRLFESHRMQLRFDAFNLPNFVNLSSPDGTLNSPRFGKIGSAGSARILQVSAKYTF